MINTDEAFEVDAFDASALGKKRVTPPAIKKSRRVAHQTPKLTKSLPKYVSIVVFTSRFFILTLQ